MSSYFQLFHLPEHFVIDTQALEKTYQTLAAQFHPDKFVAASAFEQKQAMMMTATLNQAYSTLHHPINRAAYLLQQHQLNPDDPHNTQMAPEFLMQQMQWRETLAQAREEHDHASIHALNNEILRAREQLLTQLADDFAHHRLEAALIATRQGRFLDKMLYEIQLALD